MHNLNSPQALSDAAFQQVNEQLIAQARDADLSIKHRRDWEARKIMVLVEPPVALRTAIRTRQDAIQRQQQRLEDLAKDIYTASVEVLKRRYRERRDITGLQYDQGQKELHSLWQSRRVDLARRYVYTFADARLKKITEKAYDAARATSDEVWAGEGVALLESYSMPESPAWATEPARGVEDDDRPARCRSAR